MLKKNGNVLSAIFPPFLSIIFGFLFTPINLYPLQLPVMFGFTLYRVSTSGRDIFLSGASLVGVSVVSRAFRREMKKNRFFYQMRENSIFSDTIEKRIIDCKFYQPILLI